MTNEARYPGLDGWRALSILSVMAGHLLPLGPKSWQLNATATTFGMALFFCLSGFLITSILLRGSSVKSFLIRRAARILPLAWAGILVAYATMGMSHLELMANAFFYANWPPMKLVHPLPHYWSLCVEIQFYLAVAILVMIGGKRSLYVLPLLGLVVTALRWAHEVPIAINTYYRIDEILAGASLAIAYFHSQPRKQSPYSVSSKGLRYLLSIGLVLFLLATSYPGLPELAYLRPYAAALVLGIGLFFLGGKLPRLFNHPYIIYIASISYALYVVHLFFVYGWFSEGTPLEKYGKRILLGFPLIWLLSHVSTKHFESVFIQLAKRPSKS